MVWVGMELPVTTVVSRGPVRVQKCQHPIPDAFGFLAIWEERGEGKLRTHKS